MNVLKSTQIPSWLILLSGILLGRTETAQLWISFFLDNLELLSISLYSTGVVVYLACEMLKWVKTSIRERRAHARAAVQSQRLVESQDTATKDTPPLVNETSIAKSTVSDEIAQRIATKLSGSYKLVSNENFEQFLAVQGVPWALRSAANQARPTHHITIQGTKLTIQIQGIIESSTTYIIGGPAVETEVRGRIFEDKVEFLTNENDTTNAPVQGPRVGIVVRKRAVTEDYDVSVQRELSDDDQKIVLTSIATFRDGRNPVTSRQFFDRI